MVIEEADTGSKVAVSSKVSLCDVGCASAVVEASSLAPGLKSGTIGSRDRNLTLVGCSIVRGIVADIVGWTVRV